MTLQIQRNDALEACESASPAVRKRVAQREAGAQPAEREPSVFHALQAPSITPVEYLRRLARYAFCSRSAFILAFYYLQKICKLQHARLTINSLSIHRRHSVRQCAFREGWRLGREGAQRAGAGHAQGAALRAVRERGAIRAV
ncbi:cyclin-dependent protein kinase [Gracilaria domingensis]|nr:cyclin-dependent protein kinase [Gracilaria domingensis]